MWALDINLNSLFLVKKIYFSIEILWKMAFGCQAGWSFGFHWVWAFLAGLGYEVGKLGRSALGFEV